MERTTPRMTARLRTAASRTGLALAVLAWLAIAWICLAGDPGRGAGCSGWVYRDPVTGRPAGLGAARVGPDGSASCPRG